MVTMVWSVMSEVKSGRVRSAVQKSRREVPHLSCTCSRVPFAFPDIRLLPKHFDATSHAMDGIVAGLNPAQREAVTSDAKVVQVLAPPGSGKTKTLTARVAYLIAHQQLKPWNIITCTFTRKAANEMKERIRNFVGVELAKQIKLGTFHSIAIRYLRQYGHLIGLEKDFGIADSSDSKAIIKRIIKRRDFGMDVGPALGRISSHKCKGPESDSVGRKAKSVEQQEFVQLFGEYEAELQASNLLDYDDLLLKCVALLRGHPGCVSNVQAVLIDEFQDTNNIQYDLMSLFAQRNNVITIVGDPDQSIYAFRNAEIGNLKRMKTHWPDTLTINLAENYRSSGAILGAAQNIIEQDQNRPPKKLQATHTYGQRPVLRKLPTAAAEAAWLVSEIKRMCALTAHVLQPSDFAILLRSAPLSCLIETALGREGVPYRMVGGTKFYDRAEVKLVLDYLRVVSQPGNNEVVDRIINVPSRRIGEATVRALHEEARLKSMSLWDLIRGIAQGNRSTSTKLSTAAKKGLAEFVGVILSARERFGSSAFEQGAPIADLIDLVVKKIDLQSHLKNKYENEHEARWANVEELKVQAADASDPERLRAMLEEEVLPEIEGMEQRQTTAGDTLALFLANVALATTAESKAEAGSEPAQQVTISTIHSAKGLEWPVVFIPACFEGSIPHSRAEDNDEERRLLYVGMTRAQAMLYLSCPVKSSEHKETAMSSFLTVPGVDSFLEEHGPSMMLNHAAAIAVTLSREAPTSDAFEECKQGLERTEDSYWPLNGEMPAEEVAKWDYGKADNAYSVTGFTRPTGLTSADSFTIQQQPQGFSNASALTTPGFVSAQARYEELLEESRLKEIDKKAADARKDKTSDVPKGRKRQIDGQGTLSSFFNKKVALPSAKIVPETTAVQHAPLRDISNVAPSSDPGPLPRLSLSTTLHKPNMAPMRRPAAPRPATPIAKYVLLSSSPTQPPQDENQPTETAASGKLQDDATSVQPHFRPASTFHATSMQALKKPNVGPKRYGAKPSFNGWANRANK